MKNLIFGTDFCGDCDDVVALRVISRSIKAGKVNLLGVIVNDANEYSASAVEGFLNKDGIYDIPVGVDPKRNDFDTKPTYLQKLSQYSEKYKSIDDAEDGVRLYRRLVANSKDKVEIVEVGFLQVLCEFLLSEPDDISDKSGIELIKEKVAKIWIMGGTWNVPDGKEFNFARNEISARGASIILDKCPAPITFLGWEIGNSVISGRKLKDGDHLLQALTDHGFKDGRSSWDPMTVLLCIIGDENEAGYDIVQGTGRADIKTGINNFTVSENGNHRYVIKKFDDSYYENQLDEIIS